MLGRRDRGQETDKSRCHHDDFAIFCAEVVTPGLGGRDPEKFLAPSSHLAKSRAIVLTDRPCGHLLERLAI